VLIAGRRRNAATVPETATHETVALDFVTLLRSTEGQAILKKTGQSPVVPAFQKGTIPRDIE